MTSRTTPAGQPRKPKRSDFATAHDWMTRKDEHERKLIEEADYFTIWQLRGQGKTVSERFDDVDSALAAAQDVADEFPQRGVLVYAVREVDMARTPVTTIRGRRR